VKRGELNKLFAENLRRRRLAIGISQEQLAARCGLHRTYVGAIERGERNVTLATVERLAASLDKNPLDLLSAAPALAVQKRRSRRS